MTFLYDANNHLVPVDQWPAVLAEVKKHVGDGYFCVSDKAHPSLGNEPPADCVRVVYGSDMAANFKGLMDAAGKALTVGGIPNHKWLLVEYSAAWCAPCKLEGQTLADFFRSDPHAGDYV